MQRFIKILIILTIIFNIHTIFSFGDSVGEVTIFVGEEVELNALLVKNKVISEKASVTWKTGDGSIVSISGSGRIKGIKEGRSYISANVNSEEKSTSAVVIINVRSAADSLNFDVKSVSMLIGDVYNPGYSINPVQGGKVYNQKIRLASKDPNIAYIDSSGAIVAVKTGETEIYGYTDDGNKIDKFKLSVVEGYKKIYFTNIKMDDVFYVGEKLKLNMVDDKGNSLVSPVIFEISGVTNEKILNISNRGEIEFIKAGTVRIDCVTLGEKRAAATVQVKSMVKKVKIDKRNITFTKLGETDNLEAWLTPIDDKKGILVSKVLWSSTNSSVVSVDQNGNLTAVGYGVARITAITVDGKKTDSMSVEVTDGKKVEKKISRIEVKSTKDIAMIGEEIPLEVTIIPEDAENKSISFTVESGGGSVSQKDGVYYYKGNKIGLSKIKATANNGPEDRFDITVKSPLQSISISDSMLKDKNMRVLYVGQEVELTVDLTPKSGYGPSDIYEKGYNVTFSNSNLGVKDKNESSFKVTANSPGFSSITITTVDNTNKVIIPVKVENLIESISVKKEDNVSVGQKYTPEVTLKAGKNLYGIEEALTKDYTINIIESYVLRDYLQNEVEYEKRTMDEMEELIKSDPRKYGNLRTETQVKRDRINTFESMLKTSNSQYIKLIGSSGITDRIGQPLKIATEDDKNIVGITRGYVVYQIKTKDGEKTASSRLYFNSTADEIVITKGDDIISSSEENLKSEIEEKSNLPETKALKEKISTRFGDSSANDIPTTENIEYILNLEEKIILSNQLKGDYRSTATKEDGMLLVINIFESFTGIKFKEPAIPTFVDDTTGISTKAYNLGAISITADRKANPSSAIDVVMLKDILKRISNTLEKKKSTKTVDYTLQDVPKEMLDKITKDGIITVEEMLVIANYIIK